MNNKPAIAVELLPNEDYQFTPKPTYYLVSGKFTPGQTIDVSRASGVYKVQFKCVTMMSVNFTEDNKFAAA